MKNTKIVARLFLFALSLSLLISCLSGCVVVDDPSGTQKPIDGVDTPSGTDATDSKNDAPTISEQVLFEQNGVKVTAKEYKRDSFSGDGIGLLIENNSASDIGVGVNELIVNNYMISNLFSKTIAAGKKANETLELSPTELSAAGITTVGQIEATFYLFNADTFETICTIAPVIVKTSAFDTMSAEKQDNGVELLNQNGIRIVGKHVNENTMFGAEIIFFIENNSGKNVVVQAEDVSVNGYMISSLFSCTVFDGKMAVDSLDVMSSDLEENNIASISEIEVKFHICDAESFEEIFTTDAIKFSARSAE